jgi:Domain of unknown function (DUF1963)
MVHEQFDLGLWKSRFPLQKLIDNDTFGRWRNTRADYVTSPGELALELQIRDATQAKRGPFKKEATDVFVFGKGESKQLYLTKVGGKPYLSEDVAWPEDEDGMPLSFVAQFCFSDSKDLVGKLPGDVLLIFGSTVDEENLEWERGNADDLTFIWMDIDEDIEIQDIPEDAVSFKPYYSQIFRSFDLLDPDPFIEVNGEFTLLPSILPCTKIGGVPFWAQEKEKLPGKPLCMLSDLSTYDKKMNLPSKKLSRAFQGCATLSTTCYLYFFIHKGKVFWTAQGS